MNGLGRRLAFLVGCLLGGCWMSHEPALVVDAGDSSAASEPDGGGWVPPAPTCPTDTPSLIIPPGPGCTSVRIREGRTIPRASVGLHPPPANQCIYSFIRIRSPLEAPNVSDSTCMRSARTLGGLLETAVFRTSVVFFETIA